MDGEAELISPIHQHGSPAAATMDGRSKGWKHKHSAHERIVLVKIPQRLTNGWLHRKIKIMAAGGGGREATSQQWLHSLPMADWTSRRSSACLPACLPGVWMIPQQRTRRMSPVPLFFFFFFFFFLFLSSCSSLFRFLQRLPYVVRSMSLVEFPLSLDPCTFIMPGAFE
ncbi:hypothetical protein IWX50DRAFT_209009 [Phyllosticta citricarpa]|uniref:Uncharacterized protein n=1 Tax=Phyllosticta citricarpa TaxID=55181 RepID=A0ABR1MR79_9PEZI